MNYTQRSHGNSYQGAMNEQTSNSCESVTMVVPARDAAATIEHCLLAARDIQMQPDSPLTRIILVNDGSRDATAEIARKLGIEVINGTGRGAAAARNMGWLAATTDLIWFIDADCIPDPNSLNTLLPHLRHLHVAGVGGTYSIGSDASLLQRLIHEEIKVRHAKMPVSVDFLATFDVLYRRSIMEYLHGFDERFLKGQDAEFAFRVIEAGHQLHFEPQSIVEHHHADRLGRYLKVQRQQGYWRVALHLEHRGRGRGNSYSSALDHAQPFVATAIPIAAMTPLVGTEWWTATLPLVALLVLQLPMAVAMAQRAGPSMLAFIPLGALRAAYRAVGMWHGVIDRIVATASSRAPKS